MRKWDDRLASHKLNQEFREVQERIEKAHLSSENRWLPIRENNGYDAARNDSILVRRGFP